MKRLIAIWLLLFAFAVPHAFAGSVYVEGGYQAIWDNLDQDTTTVGAGVMFQPVDRLQIDVGADYVQNNDFGQLGFNQRSELRNASLRPYEDDWLLGINVRYYLFEF